MRPRVVALLLLVAAFSAATQQTSAHKPAQDEARRALRRGDFDAALSIADRALMRRNTPEARELLLIAKADAIVQKDKAKALTILDGMPPTVTAEGAVRRLISRGYVLTLLNEYQKADAEYAKAADLASRIKPELRPEVLMNWMAPTLRSKKYDRAISLAREAIAGAERLNQPFVLANTYGMLGLTELRHNQWELGLQHCDEATRFARAAEAHNTLQLITGNVGWAYQQLGDLDEAKVRFEQAEAAAEAAHVMRVQPIWLANLANVYVTRREFPTALSFAVRAVKAARSFGDNDLIATSLTDLAQVHIELGQYDAARRVNDEALTLQRKGDASLALINQARIDQADGKFDEALTTLAVVARQPQQDAHIKWQAEAFAASIYEALRRPAEARRMYEAALDSGDAARGQILDTDSYLLFAFETNLIRFYDDYINFLLSNSRTVDALGVAERSRARTLREGLGLLQRGEAAARRFSPTELSRAHHATILCYWLAPIRSLLWVVKSDGVEVIQLPPKKAIEDQIDAYRREILNRTNETDSIQGRQLYEMLVAPAVPHIRSSRVIVVPHGRLNSMNLEAAVVPLPQPHYWLEDVTLSYAPALHFLQPAKTKQPAKPQRLLLVGNVPAEGTDFPALQRAGTEIDAIARHFAPTQRLVLAGLGATPSAYLKSSPERFDVIHFAAHGTANERVPLESSVILAGGRLSGDEIIREALQAQLVTVSSCNSAGKRSYAGEGLVGLAWAFLRAGAQRVIAAQWDVSDAASPKLMEEMYAEMAKGRDPASALHQAKLSMLRSGGKDKRPFNWAPFILYGAP